MKLITFALATFLMSFVFHPIAVLIHANKVALQLFFGTAGLICVACRIVLGLRFFSVIAFLNWLVFTILGNWSYHIEWIALGLAAIVVMIVELTIKRKLYYQYQVHKALLILI
jgi:hypothetical protein